MFPRNDVLNKYLWLTSIFLLDVVVISLVSLLLRFAIVISRTLDNFAN